jgi:hypothetical protein
MQDHATALFLQPRVSAGYECVYEPLCIVNDYLVEYTMKVNSTYTIHVQLWFAAIGVAMLGIFLV